MVTSGRRLDSDAAGDGNEGSSIRDMSIPPDVGEDFPTYALLLSLPVGQ